MLYRAHTGVGLFWKFWKVMEIYNVIFKALESFQKRELFQNGFGKVLDLVLGNSKIY